MHNKALKSFASLTGTLRRDAAPRPLAYRWASKVMPSYLAAVPRKVVSFSLGPEWLSLKRKSQECCG